MPSRSRPVTSMRAACRRAKDSATRARAPVGSGWARRVPTTHSVASAGAVASRWARVRRVASSAQCRSSSTTSSGVVAAASTTRRAMSFQRANADWAGVSPPSTGSSWTVGLPSVSSTERHGHSGGAPSSCEHRPTATVKPRRRACSARSSTSRVFPMPGSPTTWAEAKPPAAAASSCAVSAARSASRPTGTAPGDGTSARGGAVGAVSGGDAGAARVRSISGDWRSTADSSARSRGPGSMPSSSASVVRTVRSASSASA